METFHEDILETFIFCFSASLGIIQVMAARRGWHGLSLYGGRVRRNVNNVLGAALLIFAYAYYFSDPLHRNVRNIEGFMSLVCLALGVVAAAAVTLFLSSLCEETRRRLRTREARRKAEREGLKRLFFPEGTVFYSPPRPGDRGGLLLVGEPGRLQEGLVRSICSSRPPGTGFLSLHPSPGSGEGAEATLALLEKAAASTGAHPREWTVVGLGVPLDVLHRREVLLRDNGKSGRVIALAPDPRGAGILLDSLSSNTTADITRKLSLERFWKGERFRKLFNMWWPLFAACALVGTALTWAFDVRWKFLSGPLGGLVVSVWLAYYVAGWRGLRRGSAPTEGTPPAGPAAGDGPGSGCIVVLTADYAGSPASPGADKSGFPGGKGKTLFWKHALKGKFLLDRENLPRFLSLAGGGEGDAEAEGPEGRTAHDGES